MKNAYFAGGCFWCISYVFESLKGVKDVISGFSGGSEINPTYEDAVIFQCFRAVSLPNIWSSIAN